MMVWRREVVAFLEAALECSVYVSPLDPGLTDREVLEVGLRAGLLEAELRDAISETSARRHSRTGRLMPESTGLWGEFSFQDQPDYRNIAAFDFVARELRAVVEAQGIWAARLDRAVIVERAVAKNIPRKDVEAAITIWLIDGHLRHEKGGIRFATGRDEYPLPSEQQRAAFPRRVTENTNRRRAFPLVKDVIERRSLGQPNEPLDASAYEK